jgi:DNA-binding FadR family transcriptional regulator
MLAPALATLIEKVPQAAARIATAQKRIAAAIREKDPVQAQEWMAKHVRDFRRGFEIARIALERPIGQA